MVKKIGVDLPRLDSVSGFGPAQERQRVSLFHQKWDAITARVGRILADFFALLKKDRQKGPFSELESNGFRLLEKSYDTQETLQESEKELLAKFFVYSMNRKKLKEKITKIEPKSESQKIVQLFAGKTRDLRKFKRAVKKAKDLEGCIDGDEKVRAKQKLSMSEVGVCQRIIKVGDNCLAHLKAVGVTDKDPVLNELYEDYLEIKNVFGRIQVDMENAATLEDGDILLNESWNAYQFSKRQAYLPMLLFGRVFHPEKVYFNKKENQYFKTDVNGGYDTRKLGFQNLAYSRVYRICISRLISKEYEPKLIEKFGAENWEKELQDIYRKIERELHNTYNKVFSRVSNSPDRQNEILKTVLLNSKQQRTAKNEFDRIHERVYEQNDDKFGEMYCSEYISIVMIASLVHLERHLKEILSLEEGRVLNIPFDEHLKVEYLHPQRLISILKNQEVFEEVTARPNLMRQMINGSRTR